MPAGTSRWCHCSGPCHSRSLGRRYRCPGPGCKRRRIGKRGWQPVAPTRERWRTCCNPHWWWSWPWQSNRIRSEERRVGKECRRVLFRSVKDAELENGDGSQLQRLVNDGGHVVTRIGGGRGHGNQIALDRKSVV